MSLFIVVLLFIFMSSGLIWYFVSRDRGAKEPVDALWLAAGFGILAAILAALTELKLMPTEALKPTIYTPTSTILAGSMATGLIEEVFKFVPLALYLYKKPYFNEYTDGIIYFTIAGISFGAPENILYAFQFGMKTGVLRIFLTPYFHAAMTAFVGFYLISAKRQKRSMLVPGLALLAVSILHGIYNFGLLTASRYPAFAIIALTITFGMSAYLLVLYQEATDKDRLNGYRRALDDKTLQTEVHKVTNKAKLGLTVSALAIPLSIVPILGLALGVVGLFYGTTTGRSSKKIISRLTIILSTLAIMAAIGFLAAAAQK